MLRTKVRAAAVGVVVVLSMLALPAASKAGGPGVWTKLDTLDNGADTVGLLQTDDGIVHLVWLAKRASNGRQSYNTAAISLGGRLLAKGTAISNWQTLEQDPQLVPNGSGMRLIFEGSTGASGCPFDGGVVTATSATGSTWNFVNGSMSHGTVGIGNLAATTESNGTPIATFAGGHLFHVGVDPSCPASSPDGTIPEAPGNTAGNPAIVTDSRDGSVWVATYQAFAKQGYFVNRILPTLGPSIEAPHSAPHQSPFQNNQPNEPVALAARPGGGVYMAYCVASASGPCAHIDLWRVGSPTAMVVPGSANVTNARVTLAAGLKGRLSIVWYDSVKNVIHVVRTNTKVSAFGVVETVKPPPHTAGISVIQAQATFGRLDVVAVDESSTSVTIALFHTQVLAGLSFTAKPNRFSNKKATRVTFTVSDAGEPVAGAIVACRGKKGFTNVAGRVKFTFRKGSPTGRHVCTAAKTGYNLGKTTIRVT